MTQNWKTTADLYTTVLQTHKPKMIESKLNKLEFGYIHHIFTQLMSRTGFGKGLFENRQLDPKRYKNDPHGAQWFLLEINGLLQKMASEVLVVEFGYIIEKRDPEPEEIEQVHMWL